MRRQEGRGTSDKSSSQSGALGLGHRGEVAGPLPATGLGPAPVFLARGRRPGQRAAHLEVIQHLFPGQEQQGLLPDLPGDLRVEEGVLAAAVRHPLGRREKIRSG